MEDFYIDIHGDKWVDDHGAWMKEARPCGWCGESTHRLDFELHSYVHAGECEDSLWKDYFTAGNG